MKKLSARILVRSLILAGLLGLLAATFRLNPLVPLLAAAKHKFLLAEIEAIEVDTGVGFDSVDLCAEVTTANFGNGRSAVLGCGQPIPNNSFLRNVGIAQASQLRFGVRATQDLTCAANIFLVATVISDASRNTKELRFKHPLNGGGNVLSCKNQFRLRCTNPATNQTVLPACDDPTDPNSGIQCPNGFVDQDRYYLMKAALVSNPQPISTLTEGETRIFALDATDTNELQLLINAVGADNIVVGIGVSAAYPNNAIRNIFTSAGAPAPFTINPTTLNFSAASGNSPVTITAANPACRWSVDSDGFFGSFNPSSGTGSGATSISVFPNTDAVPYAANLTIGGQTLNVNQASVCGQAISAINIGQSVNGTLSSASDCQFVTNHYADRYSFSATAGQKVAIRLNAAGFNAFLQLFAAGSDFPLNTDDNGGGGTNARIPGVSGFFTLPFTGSYYIVATSAATTGAINAAYTLELRGLSTTCADIASITSGPPVSGQLAASDCKFAADNGNADFYEFSGNAGQRIAVTLTSAAFDARLYLYNLNETQIAFDDNGGGGTNARIPATSGFFTLPTTGTYYLAAKAASSTATGNYTLTLAYDCPAVTGNPANQTVCTGANVNFTAAATGSPNFGVQWQESPPGCTTFSDIDTFDNPSAGTTTLTLTSVTAGMNGTRYRAVFTGFAAACNGGNTSLPATLTVNSVSVAPPNQTFAASSGNGSIAVTAVGGACSWTATPVSDAIPWITITSGGTGNGTGTVNYSVASNIGVPRYGTITILRQFVNVTQAGCLTVNPPTLPLISAGQAFSQTFTATGGAGPFTFSLSGEPLPTGLTFSASGVLAGTPTQLGNFCFTVKATGAGGCMGARTYQLTVNRLAVNPSNPVLPSGTQGQAYSQTFTATTGLPPPNLPNTFRLTGGQLPPGLSLATSGALTGTPSTTGLFSFTVRVTDNFGYTGERQYSLRICPVITLNPANAALPAGALGQAYSQTISATGGVAPLTFTVSAGSLPPNLTLSSGGLLAGAPTGLGLFNFTVRVTDANGCFAERAYSLRICPLITLQPTALANGNINTAYNQTLTASGGVGPYMFTLESGTLPSGLSLTTGGVLSGTPAQNGVFNPTIKATDANGCTGTRAYTFIISGNGLQFFPLSAPVRLLDTRVGTSPNACSQPNAPIAGGTSRIQAGRSICTIPANAVALTGNITTVLSGGGFLTLYPSDATQPTVANTNYNANEIINNVFTVGLGAADGAFKIFALNTTDVVVDVTGYYAPPAANGLFFHPLPAPVRLLETRAGFTGCVTPGAPLVGNADSTQQAISACTGIPAAARAIVGNATTVGPQGGGFLTIFPANAARPVVAASNFNNNQIVNGPFAVGLAPNGQFKIYTTSTTDLVVDVLGYYSTEVLDANSAGLLLTPLAHPIRLLETRPGLPVGCFKPGVPLTGGAETAQTARGLCDGITIPANALGVVGNATVVQPLGQGFLTLWPSTVARPLVATSNYNAGDVGNRHFIVGLGNADGAFKIYTQATSHLVVDLSGYFAP